MMKRWTGKVAIVSGASSGIGAAIAKVLVNHNVKVVGLARRLEKLNKLQEELGKDKFFPLECDVTKEEDILKAFKWTEKELGGVDILVNNAGVASNTMVIDTPTKEYRRIVDTNLIAPAIFAREAVQSMKKRDVAGHIININSIAGQFAEALPIPFGLYSASKYGLRALGTELRHEIILSKLNIKVTNITPGAVLTEAFEEWSQKAGFGSLRALKDLDIADAIIYVLGTPEGVEIPELTIIPQNQTIGIPGSLDNN